MGREKGIFLLQRSWWPWELLRQTHSLQSLRTGSWENWQKPEVVRILTKVSFLSSLSVVPGQNRKLKFHTVPSFPNSDCQVKKEVINPFSPQDSYYLLVYLICVLRTWLENCQVGGGGREGRPGSPQNMAGQKCELYFICSYKLLLPKLICKEL